LSLKILIVAPMYDFFWSIFFNKYEFLKSVWIFPTFFLKNDHNFKSFQYMQTILSFSFENHNLQLFIICHVHYTTFTCGKGLLEIWNLKNTLKFWNFEIILLLNCECFWIPSSRYYHINLFYHLNFFIRRILCKINYLWCNYCSSSKVLY